jgi:hypothetical protein
MAAGLTSLPTWRPSGLAVPALALRWGRTGVNRCCRAFIRLRVPLLGLAWQYLWLDSPGHHSRDPRCLVKPHDQANTIIPEAPGQRVHHLEDVFPSGPRSKDIESS